MKKTIKVFILCVMLLCFTSCSKQKNDKERTTVNPKEISTSKKSEKTTDVAQSVVVEPSKEKVQTGKTLTGRKPLKEVKMKVNDPNNEKRLSTKGIEYSYGVSKDGKPHNTSVKNQKYFDSFGALALDTKTKNKVIYLTFDCGYENGYTEKILDVLKEKQVPAAFFVTLPYLKENLGQQMAIRMINEGHIVGNHSTTHPVFSNISRTQMVSEIESCDNYLRTNFGYTSPYFRFPTGEYSESSLQLVESLGYTSVFWSLAYLDYDVKNQPSPDKAFTTITTRMHPGAVMLLHAVSSTNAQVLGDVIDWARAQGYTFVALTDYKV